MSHEFVLEPKVKGPFTGGPAVVKYRVAAKSRLQVKAFCLSSIGLHRFAVFLTKLLVWFVL